MSLLIIKLKKYGASLLFSYQLLVCSSFYIFASHFFHLFSTFLSRVILLNKNIWGLFFCWASMSQNFSIKLLYIFCYFMLKLGLPNCLWDNVADFLCFKTGTKGPAAIYAMVLLIFYK